MTPNRHAMPSKHAEILRAHSRPLSPVPTGQEPMLKPLPGIRAVLFDVYGTLFVSGSGEVGTEAAPSDRALVESLRAVGVEARGPLDQGVECFFKTIETMHARLREAGRDYPEVDVLDVWSQVLAELGRRGVIDPTADQSVDIGRLAVEYEVRANPVWPMPGARECLQRLHDKGFVLGIVSNAQFYTPELFEALLGKPPKAIGFDRRLQYYSYLHGWGKPSLRLFELAAEALARRGIAAGEVVYVGNDMLNDVFPAHRVGFRTALFAGDSRSLRLREDDPRVEGIVADLVLTRLEQLLECMIK